MNTLIGGVTEKGTYQKETNMEKKQRKSDKKLGKGKRRNRRVKQKAWRNRSVSQNLKECSFHTKFCYW